MVGVMPDYNDIGTCNNITYAGLKLFLMPINSSHKSETTLEQLNELGSEFIDQSLISPAIHQRRTYIPVFLHLLGVGYLYCTLKVNTKYCLYGYINKRLWNFTLETSMFICSVVQTLHD